MEKKDLGIYTNIELLEMSPDRDLNIISKLGNFLEVYFHEIKF